MMLQLTLSQEEYDELVSVLEEYLSELRMEIADTDSYDYKDTLKHEKSVLNDLLTRLKALKAA
jgi:hypothetical protein